MGIYDGHNMIFNAMSMFFFFLIYYIMSGVAQQGGFCGNHSN
jgi:hypothetical protein